MRYFFSALLFAIALPFLGIGQKPESVLFTIGDQNVMLSEFQYIYQKNNKNDSNYYKEASVKEYLDLFINFKLKVKEAKNLGLDTTESFKKEFANYREQLTKPYMTDKSTIDNLMKEAYERMKWELRASHILIRLPQDASPALEKQAEDTINMIYKKALKGEDFAKLATQYSQDPSVKFNKGDLGYFSVFHLIYSFENVAYNTPVGKISKPFRTEFGYHILKITDKRPYQGTIKIAQLFVRNNSETPGGEDKMAKARIDSAYNRLLLNAKFEDVVAMYSQDERSKMNKGEVPEFNMFTYSVPMEIKEEAFKLKNNGDYSKPFSTNDGWYIIQRKDLKPLAPYEDLQNYIKTRVMKDSRSDLSQTNAIANMKKQYHFKAKKGALEVFYNSADTTLRDGKWKAGDESKYKGVLFTIGKENVSQLEFAKYIETSQIRTRYGSGKYAIDQYYQSFVNEKVTDYADRHLEENYPEFRNLVNEYQEGMLLFEVMDKMVWTKAMTDSIGQRTFFEANRANYMWNPRVNAEIIICRNKDVAAKAETMLKAGKNPDDIATELNKENSQNISFSKGKYEKGEMPILDKYFDKTGIYSLADESKETVRIINIKEIIPPDFKKFEEIKGIVIADFQNYLDKQWIDMLKAKYPVTINNSVLKSIIKP